MQTESLLVRRAATVSPQDAKARLAEKYPAYKLVEFKTEIDNDNNQFYVASLMKAAEHPEVGVEPLDVGGPESPPEAPEAPKEEKSEHKEEKSEGGLEHKLDKILDMLHTLVGGGDDSDDSLTNGSEGPVDSKPLPPPVPEPLPSMGQAQHPMFAKKKESVLKDEIEPQVEVKFNDAIGRPTTQVVPLSALHLYDQWPGKGAYTATPIDSSVTNLREPTTPRMAFAKKQQLVVVRDNSKNVMMAEAKAELDAEFNQHGFKVAKMVRRDDKIVAGLIRVAILRDDVSPALHQRPNRGQPMRWDENGYPIFPPEEMRTESYPPGVNTAPRAQNIPGGHLLSPDEMAAEDYGNDPFGTNMDDFDYEEYHDQQGRAITNPKLKRLRQ